MRRGPALMAVSPTAMPSPGSVTVPTPSPPRMSMRGVSLSDGKGTRSCALSSRTSAQMLRPFVMSGSSPASFTTAARATVRGDSETGVPSSVFMPVSRLVATCRVSPSGRMTGTAGGHPPPASSRLHSAATAAAVAQVPVVSPLRRGKNSGSSRSTARRSPCLPSTVRVAWGNTGRLRAKIRMPSRRAASVFSGNPPEMPLSLSRMACGRSCSSRRVSSSPER